MARPRYGKEEETARAKLVRAFWELLAEMSYERIGARSVAARAGLNKNTFYYHFENMEALAREAMDGVLVKEIPAAIMAGINGSRGTADNAAVGISQDKVAHLAILLSPNGKALQPKLSDVIADTWIEMLEERNVPLDKDNLIMLRFASGGLVNILRGLGADEIPTIIEGIGTSPMLSEVVGAIFQ